MHGPAARSRPALAPPRWRPHTTDQADPYRKGDLDGAIEAGLKIVELEPDDPLGHTNLSILYQAKDMIQEAEDEKALAMQLQLQAESDPKTG